MSKLKPQYLRVSHGLMLSPGELTTLRRASISVESRVELIRQTGGRLLIYGKESGGGAREVGHYCGFLFPNPSAFVLAVDTAVHLDRNRLHRRVYGTQLVRYELFLYSGENVHFMVTSYSIDPQRNMMRVRTLFKERGGRLTEDSAVFFSPLRASEISVPDHLLVGFRAALKGARTFACKDAVFAEIVDKSRKKAAPDQQKLPAVEAPVVPIFAK